MEPPEGYGTTIVYQITKLFLSRSYVAVRSAGNFGDLGRYTVSAAFTETDPIYPPDTANNLIPGQELLPGQSIESGNGRFSLRLQTDGNLVLYDTATAPAPGTALWATGTDGTNVTRAVMQTDGNFVLYDGDIVLFDAAWGGKWGGSPIFEGAAARWASDTHGNAGAHLRVQNDGNVVIYSFYGSAIWSTGTVVDTVPLPPATFPDIIDRALEDLESVPLKSGSLTDVNAPLQSPTDTSWASDDLLLVLTESTAPTSATVGSLEPAGVSKDEGERNDWDDLFAALGGHADPFGRYGF